MGVTEVSGGRKVFISKHAVNKRGSVHVKAHYWTINNDGQVIDNTHSIQESWSRNGLITNNTFKELFYNAVKRGAVAHNKHRKKSTNFAWTYKLIRWHIAYDYNEKRPYKIAFNPLRKRAYVLRRDRIVKDVRDDINHQDNREFILKKEIVVNTKTKERPFVSERNLNRIFQMEANPKLVFKEYLERRKKKHTRLHVL